MVDPEPGLGEGAAALLELVRTGELVDRGRVGQVRGVACDGVHACNACADEAGHVDAVARAAVDHGAAEPDRLDHAESGGVEDVLREHFLVGREAAGGDDDLLGVDDELVARLRRGLDARDSAVGHDELGDAGVRQKLAAAGLDVLDPTADDFSRAALERIPRAFPIHVAHMGGVKRG